MQQRIAVGDLVNISGEGGVWTVVGTRVRNLEPKFQVQLGMDESTIRWFQSDVVTLMQKAPKSDNDPLYVCAASAGGVRFVPDGLWAIRKPRPVVAHFNSGPDTAPKP